MKHDIVLSAALAGEVSLPDGAVVVRDRNSLKRGEVDQRIAAGAPLLVMDVAAWSAELLTGRDAVERWQAIRTDYRASEQTAPNKREFWTGGTFVSNDRTQSVVKVQFHC